MRESLPQRARGQVRIEQRAALAFGAFAAVMFLCLLWRDADGGVHARELDAEQPDAAAVPLSDAASAIPLEVSIERVDLALGREPKGTTVFMREPAPGQLGTIRVRFVGWAQPLIEEARLAEAVSLQLLKLQFMLKLLIIIEPQFTLLNQWLLHFLTLMDLRSPSQDPLPQECLICMLVILILPLLLPLKI